MLFVLPVFMGACEVAPSTPQHSAESDEPIAPTFLDVRVAASGDDGEERADGTVTIVSTDLELVDENSTQTVGIRFEMDVPREARIQQAFLRFEVDEVGVDPAELTIRAQRVSDAGDFEEIDHHVSMRPLTETSVLWEPEPWETVDALHDTPSLVDIVQEIVDRPGWDDNNEIAFIIRGSGVRVAKAFDGDGGQESAPLLHIEYLPPACEADDSCLEDPGVTACPYIGEGGYSHPSEALFDREEVVGFALEMDPADWEFQLNNPDLEDYVPATLEFCGERLEGVGMRFKKSTHPNADLPEGDPKNPMVLDINRFNPGQKLRGLRKLNVEYGDDLELVGQRLNWELMADFGLNVSRVNSAEIAVNGENIGVFTHLERVDRAYADHHFGEDDGQLFKHAYCGTFEYKGGQQSDYLSDPRCYAPVPSDSPTDFSELIGVIDQLNHSSDEDFPSVFPLIWDVEEWIRSTAALQVLVYGDSPNANANNFYTYFPADGGPTRFALWDLDMGYWSTVQPCERDVDSIQWDLFQYSECYGSLPLFERMVAVPDYKQSFLQAAYDFQTGPFAPATFRAHLDRIVAQLADPLSRDPNRHGDDAQWAEAMDLLRDTQSARSAVVQKQLEDHGFSF